jgi:hypothetical protein
MLSTASGSASAASNAGSTVSRSRGASILHNGTALYLAFCLSILPAIAIAEEFAVQIGAFRQAEAQYLEPATNYGELLAATRADGITQYSVGPFASIEDAQTALALLRAHYPDAFLRAAQKRARTITPGTMTALADIPPAAPAKPDSGAAPVLEPTLWATLNQTEKANVVYLDGVLHIKQGERLIPLAEYRRGN